MCKFYLQSMKRRLSVTKALMTTGTFSQNVGKLFSELKLVTDNLLFIYAEANWEATESLSPVLPPAMYNFSACK